MNSIKCKSCGLSNFATDAECRRCGLSLHFDGGRGGRTRAPSRFSVVSIVIFAVIAAGGFYIFTGMQNSVTKVGNSEANRVAVEAERQRAAGLSRAEEDRQRAQRVANAVNISPALAEHQRRTEERQKMIEQASNSSSQ
jgi:hypothetical protein